MPVEIVKSQTDRKQCIDSPVIIYEKNSMPCRMSHASIPAEVRAARAMPEDLIRLCVGIEDVDDLLEDLYHALTASGALKFAN